MIISRHPSGSDQWVRWSNPRTLVTATHPAEVPQALARIAALVDQGLHALGFLAYEAAPAFDPHAAARPRDPASSLPLLWFGLFESPAPFTPEPPRPPPAIRWKPGLDRPAYRRQVLAIKRRIAAGDTYQVNFTFPLHTRQPLAARDLFFHLAENQPSPFAMLIETPDFTVASASPELFFELAGDRIRTEPMKGTCPRGPLPELDLAAGEQLRTSEKNRAENIMIVDMMRNDLGRIADPGTVTVESLFDVKAWPTLWQMTSTVSARTNASVPDLLAALFPCASITGAPKLKTTEIIAELEHQPRGVYTGAIGWWMPGRQARFAVAIRTLAIDHRSGNAHYGIGSGIVWDSDPADEYRECLLKSRILQSARPPFALLETLLWEPASGYRWRDDHLQRMARSAACLKRPFDPVRAAARLDHAAHAFPAAPVRVRLLVDARGRITVQHSPSPQPAWFTGPDGAPSITARIDPRRTDPSSPFLYHKTTRRNLYHSARRRCPDADETLLVNTRGELMEFTNGNLALHRHGAWTTPELSAGLLPGIFRARLIADGVLHPRRLTLDDLAAADHVAFINSVRGWRSVQLLRD